MASSLEYPQRIEWSQSLNRLIVCSLSAWLCVCKFSHFSLFHPPIFIQYSTEECSTVRLLARSLEYPQRIRVVSVFETFNCLILGCVSANFLIFPSFILLFLYSTVQKSAVQYSYLFIKQAAADITGQLQVRPMLYTLTSRHQDIKTSRHQDVYHRPNLERACNVGCRLFTRLFMSR